MRPRTALPPPPWSAGRVPDAKHRLIPAPPTLWQCQREPRSVPGFRGDPQASCETSLPKCNLAWSRPARSLTIWGATPLAGWMICKSWRRKRRVGNMREASGSRYRKSKCMGQVQAPACAAMGRRNSMWLLTPGEGRVWLIGCWDVVVAGQCPLPSASAASFAACSHVGT